MKLPERDAQACVCCSDVLGEKWIWSAVSITIKIAIPMAGNRKRVASSFRLTQRTSMTNQKIYGQR
jgi:hypothetical protein